MKFLAGGLLVAAFAVAQILIGGTRQIYSIPACCLLGLAALIALWPRLKIDPAFRGGCIAATLLFTVYLAVRNRLSPVDYIARTDLFIITGSLITYLLTALFLARSKFRLPVAAALLVLALAHVAVGAVQFKNGDQYMPLPWIGRMDDSWRASGFYISGNHLAGMLEVTALLAVALVWWGNIRTWAKILIAYCAGCCGFGIAIAGSRGGYLSFVTGLFVLIALSLLAARRTSGRRFLGLVAAVLVLVTVAGGATAFLLMRSETLKGRIAEINDPKNPRWLLWPAAVEQFKIDPVWGTGSGTFLHYGRTFRDPGVQNDPIHVHNDYLHLAAEYGSVGAALFLLFLGTHLWGGFRNIGALAEEQAARPGVAGNQLAFQIGGVSAIAAYMVHSLVDFNLHIPANAFLMAWVFGMIANPAIGARGDHRFHRTTGLVGRIALGGLAVFMFAYGAPKIEPEYWAERARAALRDYQLAEARAFAAKGLAREKRNPDLYYYAGEAAREMFAKRMEPGADLGSEAVAMFTAGLAQFPQDVRSVYKLAHAYGNVLRFDLAEEQLERAAELDPNSTLLYAYYGLHYQMQARWEEALEQYQTALALSGGNEIALAGLQTVEQALAPLRASAARPPLPLPDEPPDLPDESPDSLREGEPEPASEPEMPIVPLQ